MHDSPTRRLLHRWFVQYNPTYLLSAVLVFAGCFLWSRSVVHDGAIGTFGIPFVAELYAASLLGAAALLTRIGQRRTAVILALVAIVYQWDTTLHTEACAYLGIVGRVGAVMWLVSFGAKLLAFQWALRVRLTPQAWAAAIVAGVGLVVAPTLLAHVGPRGAGALLAVWAFALASFDREGAIACAGLDAWGVKVLSRVTRAAWIVSGVLVGLHSVLWCMNADVSYAPLVFAVPLLFVRKVRSELGSWALVAVALASAAIIRPDAFAVTALLAAAALALRVYAPRFAAVRVTTPAPAATPEPYRVDVETAAPLAHVPSFVAATPLDAGERARALAGALGAIWLATWTITHVGGDWPAHVLWLDLAWTAVTIAAAWSTKRPFTFGAPLALGHAHFAASAGWIPTPASAAEWGGAVIALGFVMLGGSLVTSYRLRGSSPIGIASPPE